MGILSWIGGLLGSTKVIETLVSEVVNSTDEKARMLATDRLEQLQGFKIVQRMLVASAMIVFVPTALILVTFAAFGMMNRLELMLMVVSEPFIYVPVGLAFTAYLGGGTISEFRKKK